jgi:hypothetical protein
MALITKEQAIAHLRDGAGVEHETDLEMKMTQAEAHVLVYLKRTTDADGNTWTADSTDSEFPIVQAAILDVLSNLFRDRNDREKPTDGPITPRIKNALSMLRDPALS